MLLRSPVSSLFFFNDTATTEIYTLSLHDALPIAAERPLVALDAGEHEPRRRLDGADHSERVVVGPAAGASAADLDEDGQCPGRVRGRQPRVELAHARE